ncbi:MAG TPA: lanthionine synthetase C family protein [Longimicrobiales bacterium]
MSDSLEELAEAPKAIARFILGTTDTSRRDRLWPSHFLVYSTNPMSIAYGASGTALFLQDVFGELPEDISHWLLDQPLDTASYPPGLYLGLAGIAYALAELGFPARGEEVMHMAYRSPLLFADPTMLIGAAGWGWASLYFHDRTGDAEYLERAIAAGAHLLATAEREDGLLSWRHSLDGRVHFGFAYGASGIALFLLHLGLRTGDHEFMAAAVGALEHDLRNAHVTREGLAWGRFPGDHLVEPYWLHGGAGVGTTVLRFYEELGDTYYLDFAERIAESLRAKFTLLPGQWEGMSGIGEFHIDMWRLTGDASYRDAAADLAESILLYRIPRPGGMAFPGRWLDRISTDYATGSAGVGAFLQRLAIPWCRRFTDLPGRTSSTFAVASSAVAPAQATTATR